MKVAEIQFLKFLQGKKQFIIPIYQRTYSWEIAQSQQLWDDLIRTASNDAIPAHFVGSIVYVEQGLYQVSAIPQLLVIDGQQRLTTLTLLLAALARAIEAGASSDSVAVDEIRDDYLFNRHGKDSLKYRLLLTQNDRETLMRVLDGKEPLDHPARRVIANYEFFQQKIAAVDPSVLHRGIEKLVIVDIALDRTHDNPQLIFESLNSTGLELSQADLIRNYVLMGQEPETMEALYSEHWFPMERRFARTEDRFLFDRFIRDYLTFKTGRIPNIVKVYGAFKVHAQEPAAGPITDLVAHVARYSRYFVNIALLQEPDADLRQAFEDINTLKVDVAYPFLLEVYDDYTTHRLTKAEFLAVLRLVESYVFRRTICGIPTNTLNKTFGNLIKQIDRDHYVESTEAAFLSMDSYRRFPLDEEFRREFIVKDVYNLRTRNYLLRNLENAQHKDRVIIEGYTIEHIMPQNQRPSAVWRSELGPDWQAVQNRYLHTIGNLTLTLYNSSMSDRRFLDKRDMDGGFRRTPLALNDGLRELDQWNKEAIRQRATALAELAVTLWSAPHLSPALLDAYATRVTRAALPAYSLADHPHLTGAMLNLFQQLRQRILNLDSSVREEILKLYIAYKTTTNFVDVVPQASRLRLSLNMRFDEVYDPTGICKDVTNLGRWGNGDVEIGINSTDQIDDVMFLVLQAFDKQAEGADA